MAVSEPLPTFVAPMLLSTTAEVPTDRSWALEVKWDGMRAQLAFDGRCVALRSRPGRECGRQFPELLAIADVLPANAVLDGELVCFAADGWPDFERLRTRLRARTPAAVESARRQAPATLVFFDVLHLGGKATRQDAYSERRALLDELALNGPAWRTPRWFSVDEDLMTATRELQLEGVVAKRLDSAYQPGRRGTAWLKYKHRHRERLTITAWRPGDRREPDEVLVSRRDHAGDFRYAGGVRFGLAVEERAHLLPLLVSLEEGSSRRTRVRRVSPVIEVDVDYHGRLGGPLRDPVLRNVYVADEPVTAALPANRSDYRSERQRSRGLGTDVSQRWVARGRTRLRVGCRQSEGGWSRA